MVGFSPCRGAKHTQDSVCVSESGKGRINVSETTRLVARANPKAGYRALRVTAHARLEDELVEVQAAAYAAVELVRELETALLAAKGAALRATAMAASAQHIAPWNGEERRMVAS
jgi:hypothetical protein